MAKVAALQSVVTNFLRTFTSRYSEYRGYWLFGFLCGHPRFEIDLLGDEHCHGRDPFEVARSRAVEDFLDQLACARISPSKLASARLTIRTGDEPFEQVAGGVLRHGYQMTFDVTATTQEEITYFSACAHFVAPHDPALERQSVPRTPDEEGRDT